VELESSVNGTYKFVLCPGGKIPCGSKYRRKEGSLGPPSLFWTMSVTSQPAGARPLFVIANSHTGQLTTLPWKGSQVTVVPIGLTACTVNFAVGMLARSTKQPIATRR